MGNKHMPNRQTHAAGQAGIAQPCEQAHASSPAHATRPGLQAIHRLLGLLLHTRTSCQLVRTRSGGILPYLCNLIADSLKLFQKCMEYGKA